MLFCILFSACTGVDESSLMAPAAIPNTTYSCTDYQKYTTEVDCNTSTLAQCESAYTTFPNGGAICWSAVAGGELCTAPGAIAPHWEYSPGTAWCKSGFGTYPTGGFNFYRLRSLIGCRSSICPPEGCLPTVCLCTAPVTLYDLSEHCDALGACSTTSNPPVGNEQCCRIPGELCN